VAKLLGMSDSRVYRIARKLEQQKLIRAERNGWTLTGAGERELNAMDYGRDTGTPNAGSALGLA